MSTEVTPLILPVMEDVIWSLWINADEPTRRKILSRDSTFGWSTPAFTLPKRQYVNFEHAELDLLASSNLVRDQLTLRRPRASK